MKRILLGFIRLIRSIRLQKSFYLRLVRVAPLQFKIPLPGLYNGRVQLDAFIAMIFFASG